MATKRITIAMAEEAALKMVQPIKDRIAILRRKASNIIKAEYLKVNKYAYLEEVDLQYPGFLSRARNARLTYKTWCLDWTLADDCRLITGAYGNRVVIPCTEEVIQRVDQISIEIPGCLQSAGSLRHRIPEVEDQHSVTVTIRINQQNPF